MKKTAPSRSDTRRNPRTFRIVVGSIAVVAVLIGAALIWFFNRDVPDEVSLEAAVAGVTNTGVTTTTGVEPAAAGSIDGTWTVDRTTGSFSFEEATGSFVGFRIAEELAGVGSTEAVGRTPAVTGSITLEDSTLTAAEFEVDMRTIVTNDSRRDSRVQGALETGAFPTATFELTEPVDLGVTPSPGTQIDVTARGDLTIHGITRPVELALQAQLIDDLIVVVASTNIVFSDYDVTVPSAPIVLSAADNGTLEIQLLFTRT